MSAPAGKCTSCGVEMQWCFVDGVLMVRCRHCYNLFDVDTFIGTALAEGIREGREAVMPDGRPVRSVSQIAREGAEC